MKSRRQFGMSSGIRRKARRMIHREKQGRRRELQKL
jgi:hypothetical protein